MLFACELFPEPAGLVVVASVVVWLRMGSSRPSTKIGMCRTCGCWPGSPLVCSGTTPFELGTLIGKQRFSIELWRCQYYTVEPECNQLNYLVISTSINREYNFFFRYRSIGHNCTASLFYTPNAGVFAVQVVDGQFVIPDTPYV